MPKPDPNDRDRLLDRIADVERQIEARRAQLAETVVDDEELGKLEDEWLRLQGKLATSRAHPRIPLNLEAWIKLEIGVRVPARTKDVSLGGLCMRSLRADLMIGERVVVEIEQADRVAWLILDGVIAWVNGPLIGVCFEGPAQKKVVPLLHEAMHAAVRSLEDAAARLRKDRGDS